MSTKVFLNNVSFSYKASKGQTVPIFKNLTQTFKGGKFSAVMGPSGSGKTTLFRLLSAELVPNNGGIEINGKKLNEIPDLEMRRFTVSRIYQEYRLVPFLNALENVMLAQEVAGTLHEAPNRATELLERVGLSELKDSTVDMMSGGEQQRVAIARALVNRPMVLLADEPTGALDEDNTQSVTNLLREVAHDLNVAVIVATHDHLVAKATDEVLKISDQVLMRTTV